MNHLVALGSNQPSTLGSPRATLDWALEQLTRHDLPPMDVSRVYQTAAFPAGSGPDFVNAAVLVRSDLAPADVLRRLHLIEAEAGRQRLERWGPRTLDLDLLASGDLVLPDPATVRAWMDRPADVPTDPPFELILPHPRLHQRAFVLVPLEDVAATWCHPLTGRTVAQMRADLPAAALRDVVRLSP